MPKLVYKLPKYSLHKASGQARVKYADKVTYLGKFGSPESHQRYAEFIARLPKAEERAAVEPVPGVGLLYVGECVVRFYQHALGYYVHADGTPTSESETIRSALRPLTKDPFKTLPVAQFGPKKLKLVREEMIKLGWTRYTVNKSIATIKRAFTWCASEELVPADIAMGLKTVAGLKKNRSAAREKPPIGPVPDEVVDAVLPHLPELAADVVMVARHTGMRPSEPLEMTAAEIDRTDPTCWRYLPGQHKTSHKDKPRVVPIGPRAQEILLPYIVKAGTDRLFPVTYARLRQWIHRGCRRAFPHPTLSEIPAGELTEIQRQELEAWHKSHRFNANQLRHAKATEIRERERGSRKRLSGSQ